mgnify:CR=1 FL=1
MAIDVLGISGSPIRNSNTDRAVNAVLEATGLTTEFHKLSQLDIAPCKACLGCVKNNECVVKDDGWVLAEKFRDAKAFVIGAFTPYSSLDARTKLFMERMYCFRHQTGLNAGKIGAAVITAAVPPGAEGLPPASETAAAQLKFWMMEEGMTDLGAMILAGNVPCIRCGHGDDCPVSGVAMLFGPDATVESVGVNTFEQSDHAMSEAQALGRRIREAIEAREPAAV